MSSLLVPVLHAFGFVLLGALLTILGIFTLARQNQAANGGEGCLTFVICSLLVTMVIVTFVAVGPLVAMF
jgi:hypothetical protein